MFYGLRQLFKTDSFLEKTGLSRGMKDKRFNIQGFGNVGYWASKFITEEEGGIVTTITEYERLRFMV